MENQSELREGMKQRFFKLAKMFPDGGEHMVKHMETVYSSGALNAKTKRLMAVVGALVGGCRGCILGQTERAIAEGATVEEIVEALAVASSLGGTMAVAESTRIVKLLEEKGLI
jgi:AhpD family alkylhydroperoxidase